MDAAELTQQIATTGLIVKYAVDLYRKSPIPSPRWMLLTAVFLLGICGNFVVAYINKVVWDGPMVAQVVLVGFLGAVSAMLATEIHTWVRQGES